MIDILVSLVFDGASGVERCPLGKVGLIFTFCSGSDEMWDNTTIEEFSNEGNAEIGA